MTSRCACNLWWLPWKKKSRKSINMSLSVKLPQKGKYIPLGLEMRGRIVESKNSLENSSLTSFHWLILITNRDRTIRPHKSLIVTDCSHQSSSWYFGTIENWRTILRFYRVIMYSHPEILPNVRSSYLYSSFSSSTQWFNVISTPNCIRSEETRYR